jgi:hypothetical protein
MVLKFDLDADDWMEFHKHHLLNNKQFKKTKTMITFVVPVVFGVFLYYKYQSGELMMENALMVILMSALWVAFYPKRLDSKALARARSSVETGENSNVIGENEIVIDQDQIIHKQVGKDTKYEWDSMKNVIEIESSIFLFSSPLSPIIIPKKKVNSMELKELTDLLNKKKLL